MKSFTTSLRARRGEIVKTLPLTTGTRKYSLADYELGQKATGEEAKAELAAAGRPTPEQFAQALSASSLTHLENLAALIDRGLTQLIELERVTDERLVGRNAVGGTARLTTLVSFNDARKTLEECQFHVCRLTSHPSLRRGNPSWSII